MPTRDVMQLVVSDDTRECAYAEMAGTSPGPEGVLLVEDAGFTVDEEANELVASSFRVGFSEANLDREGFALLVRETVDYQTEFDLTARHLGRCPRTNEVSFILDLDHEACTATVTVRILLEPAEGVTLTDDKRRRWKDIIEDAWSEQYRLVRTGGRGPCAEYVIVIRVEWAAEGATGTQVDRAVTVRKGHWYNRAHTGLWYLENRDITVAHEFGHYLGNIDEYDGTCDGCSDRPVHESSIMSNEDDWPHPWARHYFLIERSVEDLTCSEFDTVSIEARSVVAGGGTDVVEGARDVWCNVRHELHPLLWRLGLADRREYD